MQKTIYNMNQFGWSCCHSWI